MHLFLVGIKCKIFILVENRAKSVLRRIYTEEEFRAGEGGGTDLRSNYLLNDRIVGVEDSDALLLVGTNPRYEAPVFNAQIRKGFIHYNLEVGAVGTAVDLTFDYDHLGANSRALDDLLAGKGDFAKLCGRKSFTVPSGQRRSSWDRRGFKDRTAPAFCRKCANWPISCALGAASRKKSSASSSTELRAIQRVLGDFFLTNVVTRASPTMADCVRAAREYEQNPHIDQPKGKRHHAHL